MSWKCSRNSLILLNLMYIVSIAYKVPDESAKIDKLHKSKIALRKINYDESNQGIDGVCFYRWLVHF